MKKTISTLSLILAILMIISALSSCTGGESPIQSQTTTDAESEISESNSEQKDTEGNKDTEKSEEADTESEESLPSLLEGEHAQLIAGADALANGVNAYFDSGERKNFIT